MRIPAEFLTFTVFFHQDVHLFFPNGGLIEDAIANTPEENLGVIKQSLEELNSGRYDEAQLRSIWRETKAEISPFRGEEGSCTEFLKELRTYFD
ncbi:hypothetical protein [Methylocystis echinoides]|uniref:hypothetical protein n=1 Tax=Methylocystis echinoides TaxID=29468 RepID=UPI003424C545